jgi:predicted RNA polymerase sigma factor
VSATDLHRTIEAVWRIESARVIAGLTRLTRDVGLAEDLAQEALAAALEQGPQSGVPDNPAAWLTAAAKRSAIDLFRRNAVAKRKHEELEPANSKPSNKPRPTLQRKKHVFVDVRHADAEAEGWRVAALFVAVAHVVKRRGWAEHEPMSIAPAPGLVL